MPAIQRVVGKAVKVLQDLQLPLNQAKIGLLLERGRRRENTVALQRKPLARQVLAHHNQHQDPLSLVQNLMLRPQSMRASMLKLQVVLAALQALGLQVWRLRLIGSTQDRGEVVAGLRLIEVQRPAQTPQLPEVAHRRLQNLSVNMPLGLQTEQTLQRRSRDLQWHRPLRHLRD
jgi:hypothetical protein